jgi:hypothetical protein
VVAELARRPLGLGDRDVHQALLAWLLMTRELPQLREGAGEETVQALPLTDATADKIEQALQRLTKAA